jgi:hypothetical protein
MTDHTGLHPCLKPSKVKLDQENVLKTQWSIIQPLHMILAKGLRSDYSALKKMKIPPYWTACMNLVLSEIRQ